MGKPPTFLTALHPDRLFPQNKKGPENVPDLFTLPDENLRVF